MPSDLPVVADAKRGDISTTVARQADRAVRRPRRRRRDGQSVRRRGRRSSRSSTARTGSPTSCAERRTPARPSCRDLPVEADPAIGAPARAALPPRRPPGRDLGPRRHRRPGRRRDGSGRAARRSAPSCPGLPFLVPGLGTQGGDAAAVLADGPTRASARRPDRAAACWSTSRGASPARPSGPGAGPRDATISSASCGRRARLGGAAPCATLAGASTSARASPRTPRNRGHSRRSTTTMPTPGPLELVIILVIALLILGPGKLPDVGAALGKSIREFRKASSDVQDAVKVNVDTSPLPTTPRARTSVPNPPAARDRGHRRAGRAAPDGRPEPGHEIADAPRRPWLTRTRCARPALPALPTSPDRRRPPPPVAAPQDELGHVARRSPRRAAHPSVPLDPRGRRRGRARVRRLGPGDLDPAIADPERLAALLHRARRRVRDQGQDRDRDRDRPGDAGAALPAVGVRLARPDADRAPRGPALDPDRPLLLRPRRRDRLDRPAVSRPRS